MERKDIESGEKRYAIKEKERMYIDILEVSKMP